MIGSKILRWAVILLAFAVAAMSVRAGGKEQPRGKRAQTFEELSLFDEIARKSHPVGRILGVRVSPPDKREALWRIETVAAIGLTGAVNGEYEFQLVSFGIDADGQVVDRGWGGTRPEKGENFVTILGRGGGFPQKPAAGLLNINVQLSAIHKDGTVIVLDDTEYVANIP